MYFAPPRVLSSPLRHVVRVQGVPPRQAPQTIVPGHAAAAERAQILGDQHQPPRPLHPALVVLAGEQDAALDGTQPHHHHRPGGEHRHSASLNLVSIPEVVVEVAAPRAQDNSLLLDADAAASG